MGLPFDNLIKQIHIEYANNNNLLVNESHPIYFYNSQCLKAFQVFRCIQKRKKSRQTKKLKNKYYIHAPNNMIKFWDNKREDEKMKEDTRTIDGNLECEEQIIDDLERFGRVRNTLMRYLRANFGERIANRALWRVNKRKTNGYLQENS